ncbi:LOW QUALITY PROTEIN: DYW domain, partial [Dillenia turbinata]
MDIGLIAADSLFQLVPEEAARASRWKNVTMEQKKTPGVSNVEHNVKVHTFLVGDCSHPLSKKISQNLDLLLGKVKEAGYAPETESALHNLEEEDKECHLAVHSENLAISFAILPWETIRITKSLRICGDCHIAAKLVSKLAKCEIMVRYNNCLHHFQNGVCSSKDY